MRLTPRVIIIIIIYLFIYLFIYFNVIFLASLVYSRLFGLVHTGRRSETSAEDPSLWGGGGGEGNVIFRASNLQVPMFSREKFHKSKHEKTLPIQ